MANEAGKVSADQLHQTLLVLLHSNLEGAMCTKIPYANRWVARRVLTKLQAQGRAG